jgi:pimeloyl-ACP methyl ester carboxylesterase
MVWPGTDAGRGATVVRVSDEGPQDSEGPQGGEGHESGRWARRRTQQRARLLAAEAEVLQHYGIEATDVPLALTDPPVTTRALRCGSGPPTVLLHGTTMTGAVWAPLVPHLPGRTLYLVDLPGNGLADPFDHSREDLADHQHRFVTAVLDALRLERVPVVGASMGGWYALRTAIVRPERLQALVLVTAPALALPGARIPVPMALSGTRGGRRLARHAPPPSARMMRRMLAAVGGPGSVRDVPDPMFEMLAAATALGLESSATMVQALASWRTPRPGVQIDDDELAGCPVPTLLLWGEEDKVQPPSAGARVVELLPGARLEVLPGGHGLAFDDPASCGASIAAFLAAVETGRSSAPRSPPPAT